MGNYKSGIYGLAIGDALGVPVEFVSRERLNENPVTGMQGDGTHHQPAGTWSDDTSMTLATMYAMTDERLSYDDIMREFWNWLVNSEYTATGRVFDIGNCTLRALQRYKSGRPVLYCGGVESFDNGNGSLMRILPVCIWVAERNMKDDDAIKIVHNVSSLTHAHNVSKVCCGTYYFIVKELMKADASLRELIEAGITNAWNYYGNEFIDFSKYEVSYLLELARDMIESGGYVVTTLQAALWCLVNTNSYQECVLTAVNLGADTDTVAAVAGGLAGLYYGFSNIPENWVETLRGKNIIDGAIKRLEGEE